MGMYKTFVYTAITVMSVFLTYNAISSAAFPVASNTVTSTAVKTSNIIEDVTTKFMGLSAIGSTVPATGDNELNAVDVSNIKDLASINTMLKKSDLKYAAQIFESSPGALAPGTYKVELFENGKSKGALFIKLTAIDPETIKRVMATWDIGSDVPLNAIYTVKVTQCPCPSFTVKT